MKIINKTDYAITLVDGTIVDRSKHLDNVKKEVMEQLKFLEEKGLIDLYY